MPEKAPNKTHRDNDQDHPREGKSKRGFAAMDPQRQRDIASEGGRAAHEQGKAHKFTPEEAREAGRKGGMASGAARASRSKSRSATNAGEQPETPIPAATGGEHQRHTEPTTGTMGGAADDQNPARTDEANEQLEDENRM